MSETTTSTSTSSTSSSTAGAPADSTGDGSVDQLLIDSAERLFSETCSFDAVQAAEEAGWAPEVWQAVSEAGFAWIGVSAEAGGSGGSLADACEVLRIAGSKAAPIPLAETGMLGGWLLGESGLTIPDGPVTVVPGFEADTISATASSDGSVALSGSGHRIPWVSQAERVALLVSVDGRSTVLSLSTAGLAVTPATNLAGEPRDTVDFDGVTVAAADAAAAPDHVTPETFRLRGALSRAMLMAGALEAMSALTVDYTQQRQQFGRPVARFQAVQQHLVWGAQDAVLATMAATVAARQATRNFSTATFEIASAKTVADGCASTATRWAHQAHGAMGMTQEYALHHLSRRLWAWRHEYAKPGEWPVAVGAKVEEVGADGLYPLIAS